MDKGVSLYQGVFEEVNAENLMAMLRSADVECIELALEILHGDTLVYQYQVKDLRKCIKNIRSLHFKSFGPEVRGLFAEVEDMYEPYRLKRSKIVKRKKDGNKTTFSVSPYESGGVGNEYDDAKDGGCADDRDGAYHDV